MQWRWAATHSSPSPPLAAMVLKALEVAMWWGREQAATHLTPPPLVAEVAAIIPTYMFHSNIQVENYFAPMNHSK